MVKKSVERKHCTLKFSWNIALSNQRAHSDFLQGCNCLDKSEMRGQSDFGNFTGQIRDMFSEIASTNIRHFFWINKHLETKGSKTLGS